MVRPIVIGWLVGLAGGCARAPATPVRPASVAELDRQLAGKSHREAAEYVFAAFDCTSCHTVGPKGETGFTARGAELKKNSVGCIRLLTVMNTVVHVPEAERSAEERRRAAQFGEFGCTACHQVTPGRLGLTEIGTRLTALHLGCAEVQQELSRRSAGGS